VRGGFPLRDYGCTVRRAAMRTKAMRTKAMQSPRSITLWS